MTGIPRGKDTSGRRSAFRIVMPGGIENLTTALRRGDPFTQEALDDMLALHWRISAFGEALQSRLQAHDMSELLETDE